MQFLHGAEDGTVLCTPTLLRVKPQHATAFEALMAHVVEMARKHERGVRYYECSKGVDEPGTYVVVEVYEDQQAHALHMASTWVKESLPHSMRLLDGKPDIKQYVSSGSAPAVRQTSF
jgi:quinol monooxygenase YgiN